MHPVHLHAFLAANTSKDIRQCNHYYKLTALCLKQKPRKYNHQQKQSDLRTFTLSNHHSFCPSVSPSPLARDLVESQLLADCELIFYSSEFSLWAALLLIKPPLVLLQSDPSPRHCHLNSNHIVVSIYNLFATIIIIGFVINITMTVVGIIVVMFFSFSSYCHKAHISLISMIYIYICSWNIAKIANAVQVTIWL